MTNRCFKTTYSLLLSLFFTLTQSPAWSQSTHQDFFRKSMALTGQNLRTVSRSRRFSCLHINEKPQIIVLSAMITDSKLSRHFIRYKFTMPSLGRKAHIRAETIPDYLCGEWLKIFPIKMNGMQAPVQKTVTPLLISPPRVVAITNGEGDYRVAGSECDCQCGRRLG